MVLITVIEICDSLTFLLHVSWQVETRWVKRLKEKQQGLMEECVHFSFFPFLSLYYFGVVHLYGWMSYGPYFELTFGSLDEVCCISPHCSWLWLWTLYYLFLYPFVLNCLSLFSTGLQGANCPAGFIWKLRTLVTHSRSKEKGEKNRWGEWEGGEHLHSSSTQQGGA